MNYLEIDQKLDRIEKLLLLNKKVLTFKEGCEYSGIAPKSMYQLTSSKKIPHSKPNGKKIFFSKEKLDDWLLQNEQKTNIASRQSALSYTLKRKV